MENDDKKPRILIVDDEIEILKVLQKSLESDYDIIVASRAKEALELLDERVMVVLSDQRMPEMNGSEFLKQVRDRRPDVIRMIMSGYSDMTALINSINHGEIYRYLNKPWDLEVLMETLESAVKKYEENRSLRLAADENKVLKAQINDITSELSLTKKELDRLRGRG